MFRKGITYIGLIALLLGFTSCMKGYIIEEEDGYQWQLLRVYKRYGASTPNNGLIVDVNYDTVEYHYPTSYEDYAPYFLVKQDKNYGIYDLNGKCIIPVSKRYHAVSISNQMLHSLLRYDYYYLTERDHKYGVCNLAGREILPPRYTSIREIPISKDIFYYQIQCSDEKRHLCTGVANEKGDILISPVYKEVTPISTNYAVSTDDELKAKHVFRVKTYENTYGLIDQKGNILFSPTDYENIQVITHRALKGCLYILTDKRGRNAVYDQTKNIIIPFEKGLQLSFEYEYIQKANNTLDYWCYFLVTKDNQYGIYSLEGKELLSPVYNLDNLDIRLSENYILATPNNGEQPTKVYIRPPAIPFSYEYNPWAN